MMTTRKVVCLALMISACVCFVIAVSFHWWIDRLYAPPPLHIAAGEGDAAVARRLIAEGGDVNAFDYRDWTPLSYAAAYGQIDLVELLIENGADVNKGRPITWAASNNQLQTARLLLDNGADPNKDLNGTLLVAVEGGHLSMVKLLVEYGVDLADDGKHSPLLRASAIGDEAIVEYLLSKGVESNITGYTGHTAMTVAAFYGHAEVVRVLLDAGADPTIASADGKTPLQIAELRGHSNVTALLKKRQEQIYPP